MPAVPSRGHPVERCKMHPVSNSRRCRIEASSTGSQHSVLYRRTAGSKRKRVSPVRSRDVARLLTLGRPGFAGNVNKSVVSHRTDNEANSVVERHDGKSLPKDSTGRREERHGHERDGNGPPLQYAESSRRSFARRSKGGNQYQTAKARKMLSDAAGAPWLE